MAYRTASFGTFAAGFTNLAFWGTSKTVESKVEKSEDAPKAEEDKKPEPTPAKVPTLAFTGSVSNRPHDDKVSKGGEDGFTVSERMIAVADGVGGWARKGIDPGLFAK